MSTNSLRTFNIQFHQLTKKCNEIGNTLDQEVIQDSMDNTRKDWELDITEYKENFSQKQLLSEYVMQFDKMDFKF